MDIRVTIEPGSVPVLEENQTIEVRAIVSGGEPGMELMVTIDEFACFIEGTDEHRKQISRTEGTPDRHVAVWKITACEDGSPGEIKITAKNREFAPVKIVSETSETLSDGNQPDPDLLNAIRVPPPMREDPNVEAPIPSIPPPAPRIAAPAPRLAPPPQASPISDLPVEEAEELFEQDPLTTRIEPVPDLPEVEDEDAFEKSDVGIVVKAHDKAGLEAERKRVAAAGAKVREELASDAARPIRRRKKPEPEDPTVAQRRFESVESQTAAFARTPKGLVPTGDTPTPPPAAASSPPKISAPAIAPQISAPAIAPPITAPTPLTRVSPAPTPPKAPSHTPTPVVVQEEPRVPRSRRNQYIGLAGGAAFITALLVVGAGGLGLGTIVVATTSGEGSKIVEATPEPIMDVIETPAPAPAIADAPPEPEPIVEVAEPVQVSEPEAEPAPAVCEPYMSQSGWQMRDLNTGKLILACGGEYRLADLDCPAGTDDCIVRPGARVNLTP